MAQNSIFIVEDDCRIILSFEGARAGGYYIRFDESRPPNPSRAHRVRAAIEREADRLALKTNRVVIIKAPHPKYPKLFLQLGEVYPQTSESLRVLPPPPPVIYEEL